jgi:hypothetical protein
MKQTTLSWSGVRQNYFKYMKRILLVLSFVGIFATCLAGFAQTNSPAPDAAATAASAAPAKDAAPPGTAPDAAPAAQAPAPAAPNNAAQPAAPASEAPTPISGAANPSSAIQPGVVIPLIVMDDVPLTDAIKNLARQAGINYQLDPRIGFGQLGPDGKPAPQPSVSIRWENITADQALSALLDNYSLQLIEEPKSKIARVTIKDPAAPPPLFTKIIQLKFASPSNLVVSVRAVLSNTNRSKVLPDVRTSQLVVVATEKELTAVDELVQRLDTQTKQVLIEARLIETTVNPTTKKGVDWTGTLNQQNVTFGNGVMSGTSTTTMPGTPQTTTLPGGATVSTTPSSQTVNTLSSVLGNGGLGLNTASGLTPNVGFLTANGLQAAISFLNTYSESKVLSTPRTVTLDNEEALIEVGTMFPIVNTTAGTANTTGGSTVTYSNLTVSLRVTPRISANNYVNLRIVPSVTRLGPLVQSTVGGVNNSVYEFLTRQVTTRVLIPSGNTLVMGGLVSDEVDSSNVKVPVLGDIPVLGYLFRLDSKSRTKQNLLIFITPTIVEDENFQPTKSDFLKTPLPKKDAMEDDWTAWDSGQPKDWSRPQPVYDESLGQPGTVAPANTPANN